MLHLLVASISGYRGDHMSVYTDSFERVLKLIVHLTIRMAAID